MPKNAYDEKYEIRQARYDEIPEIMDFIDKHWRKGHIMATNRKFFEYEMVVDGKVNYFIARDKKTGEIQAINGYIQASKNKDKLDTWGSIWKVLSGNMGLLGIELIKRREMIIKSRISLSMGGNINTTVPILRTIRHFEDVGKMQHFYCVAKKEKYQVAKIEHYEEFIENKNFQIPLILFKNWEELEQLYDFSCNENAIPYKDAWYIRHRFFEHPIYSYLVYGLKDGEKAKALLVCREQEYNGAKVLRLVDYIGKAELFGGISGFLKNNLKKYEYIDLYCHGFDTNYVRQAGMIELKENDTNIIPNYFSPYILKNIDIYVGAKNKGAVFFKADGDQDRPN